MLKRFCILDLSIHRVVIQSNCDSCRHLQCRYSKDLHKNIYHLDWSLKWFSKRELKLRLDYQPLFGIKTGPGRRRKSSLAEALVKTILYFHYSRLRLASVPFFVTITVLDDVVR